MPSAWRLSRDIRACLYGLMGVPMDRQVKEIIRLDRLSELTDEPVMPKVFQLQPITVNDPLFTIRDTKKLQDLVLTVLWCIRYILLVQEN